MFIQSLLDTSVGVLQWGRDQLIAEIGQRLHVGREYRFASMGPRSADRGNLGGPNDRRGFSRLQWGRDQLIAEIISGVTVVGGAALLQWGRDQLIAEMLRTVSAAANPSRLQWGRDQLIAEIWQSATPPPPIPRLQWGRDQLIAEITTRDTFRLACRHASMGPRSADRGNVKCSECVGTGNIASMGPRSADRGNTT